jgi:hypothetical protein
MSTNILYLIVFLYGSACGASAVVLARNILEGDAEVPQDKNNAPAAHRASLLAPMVVEPDPTDLPGKKGEDFFWKGVRNDELSREQLIEVIFWYRQKCMAERAWYLRTLETLTAVSQK